MKQPLPEPLALKMEETRLLQGHSTLFRLMVVDKCKGWEGERSRVSKGKQLKMTTLTKTVADVELVLFLESVGDALGNVLCTKDLSTLGHLSAFFWLVLHFLLILWCD